MSETTRSVNKSPITFSYNHTNNGNYGVCYHENGSRTSRIVFYKDFYAADDSIRNETVVHEVGHALGLGHTQPENESISVMRARGFNGEAYPLEDDKAGLKAKYYR